MIQEKAGIKLLMLERLPDKCESCGWASCIDMYIYQKYGHILGLPFVAFKKMGVTKCSHCQKELVYKDMPISLRLAHDNLIATAKTPVWMFSGLAASVIFIIFIITKG